MRCIYKRTQFNDITDEAHCVDAANVVTLLERSEEKNIYSVFMITLNKTDYRAINGYNHVRAKERNEMTINSLNTRAQTTIISQFYDDEWNNSSWIMKIYKSVSARMCIFRSAKRLRTRADGEQTI